MAGRGRSAGSVRVDVVASNAKFDKAIKASQTRLERFQRNAIRGAKRMAGQWKKAAAALGGLGLAVGAAIKNMTAYSASVVETSRVVGLTTKELENLRKLFEGDGLGVKKADRALKDFNVRVGLAQRGVGQYTRAFEELGVELRNADGSFKSNSKLLTEIAGKLQKNTNHAEAASIAYELFGTSGRDLLPILQSHGEALAESARRAGRYNTLTEEQHKKNKDLEQSLTDLKNNGIDLVHRALADYSDELTVAIDKFNVWITDLKGSEDVFDRMINKLGKMAKTISILVAMVKGAAVGAATGGIVGAAIGTMAGGPAGGAMGAGVGTLAGALLGAGTFGAAVGYGSDLVGDWFTSLVTSELERLQAELDELESREYKGMLPPHARVQRGKDEKRIEEIKAQIKAINDQKNALRKLREEEEARQRALEESLNAIEETEKKNKSFVRHRMDALSYRRGKAFMDSQGNDTVIKAAQEAAGGSGFDADAQIGDSKFWEVYAYNDAIDAGADPWEAVRQAFARARDAKLANESARQKKRFFDSWGYGGIHGDPAMAFGDRFPSPMAPTRGRGLLDNVIAPTDRYNGFMGMPSIQTPGDAAWQQAELRRRNVMVSPTEMDPAKVPAGLVPNFFRPEEEERMKQLLAERVASMQQTFTKGMIAWAEKMEKTWDDITLIPSSEVGSEGFAKQALRQRLQSGVTGGRIYGRQGTNALRFAQSDAQAMGFFREAGKGKVNEEFEAFKLEMQDIKSLAGELESSFSSFTHSLISDFKNAGEAARSLARDILKIATQRMIVNPVTNLLFGAADGSDGSGIFGSMASAFVGAFADGGRAGRGMALVGERGPELVDFSQPGMVYSTEQLGAAMRGKSGYGAPTMVFNISSTDGPGVRAAIAEATPMIVSAANSQMMESTNRVGATRTIMQGRR